MPAAAPKLPSIWNGGCALNRFGYVPPPSPPLSGRTGSRWLLISLSARFPSRSLAHRFTFHPIDQPVDGSPRCSSDVRTAPANAGVRSGEISEIGRASWRERGGRGGGAGSG